MGYARLVQRVMLGLLLLLPAGVAWAATELPVPPGFGDLDPNWRAWFYNPATLSVTVGVFTAYIRTLLKLDGNSVRIVGLAVGVVMAAVGAWVGELERNLIEVVLFGLTAGIAAGGGWDILTGLIAIVAKVFGVRMPQGTLSVEPTQAVPNRVVVLETEPPKEDK